MLIKASGLRLSAMTAGLGSMCGQRVDPTKTLRVMKLTSLLLICAALHVSARSWSQTVTYSGNNVSLETVFDVIEKQTGFVVFYDYRQIAGAKLVTLNVKDEPLVEFLENCFRNQPFGYAIEDKTIMVTKKEYHSKGVVRVTDSVDVPALMEIHGRVTDSLGNPLVGASVTVVKTRKGVMTDAHGMFTLKEVGEGVTVMVSFTGYQSRSIRLKDGELQNIVLVRNPNPLDAIQVVAYGTTSKRLNTGNATTVTAEEIERQPVSNVLQALQGRIPGMDITTVTGVPGGSVAVSIRGKNSIGNGNDPFYVVDGVPYPSQLLPNLGVGILGQAGVNRSEPGSPMSYLNPADIESITVLKDAEATAIYGSRAANGAILITTKKGKAGETRIDVDYRTGWGGITRPVKLMNTAQYLEMRHEALKNDGLSVAATDYDINGTWDSTRDIDWQKEVLGRTSRWTEARASISGGTGNTSYLIGTTYNHQTTTMPGDYNDKRGSVHFNINGASRNQRFKVGLTGSYVLDVNHLPGNDPSAMIRLLPPNAPALLNPDGSINWAPGPDGASTYLQGNPLAEVLNNTYNNKTSNLVASANLSYQVLQGLDIRGVFGYNNMQVYEYTVGPLAAYDPAIRAQRNNGGSFNNGNINTIIIEPQLSYRRVLGEGRLEVLAGGSIHQNNNTAQQVHGSGYTSDALLGSLAGAANIYKGGSTNFTYKYAAVFGSIGFNWADKYLIDLKARRDGSSRFGSANRYQSFGAAGIGWIFSKENGIEKALPWLSFGKIRASYGTTGNDQIGNYRYLSLYDPTYGSAPYQQTGGLVVNGLSNPFLQWESTIKMEGSLELGFFSDRILLSASYFRNRTSNQLLSYPLSMITGFGGITKNLPATVQNSGGEIVLTTTNVKTRSFSWTTSLNVTVGRNKLVSYPNIENSSYANSFVIGRSINIRKTYRSLGVDPATGVYKFQDAKGNETFKPNYMTDRVIIVDMTPKYYGGFENAFSYKGFDLVAMFRFKKQIGDTYRYGNFLPGSKMVNEPVWTTERWRKPGDVTDIQRYNSNYDLIDPYFDQTSSDANLTDASFIRLTNLSLSWTLPESLRGHGWLKSVRIFVQGQNLLTITSYMGNDPESQGPNNVPPTRVVTTGVHLGF